MLVDRTAERAVIDRLVDGTRRGASGVLVLRGPAGIGKSALLDYAASGARELAVARVTGLESEIALGYAGVHQLVLRYLDRMTDLPDPQRHALETVFGLADSDPPPNSLLVFLAVLSLLDVTARETPMLLVVDDAQWLDDESARLLTFVARRLHAEPIAMLFAVRETATGSSDPFDGLPSLHVVGLADADAVVMLEHVAVGPIDAAVAACLVEQTQGNPLALREIAAELTVEQLCGEFPLPEPLPVGPLLQGQFAGRARLLPPAARAVLLLASADRLGDLALLNRAAADIGVPWDDAIATVEDAGLASFTPAVKFRHPLIRSAVYHDATTAERRRVHRALADALEGGDNADRRAWHLAAAASRPDEELASALELTGERAFHRGGTHAAAEFLLRAAELTPDPVRSVDRLLQATRLRAAEGDAARAQPLLDVVLTRVQDPLQRAEAEWTQGLILLGAGHGRDALHAAARALTSIESYDSGFPLDALITAENIALYVGSLDDGSLVEDIATSAKRLLPAGESLTPSELLVKGIAVALTDGYVAAAAMLRTALAGLRAQVEVPGGIAIPNAHERANPLHLLTVNAAAALLDDAAFDAVTRSWVAFARRSRTLTWLPIALDLRSVSEVLAGRFRAADTAIAEAEEILAIVGSRGHIGGPGLGELFLDAFRGEEDKTRAAAERRSQDARERGSGGDLDLSHFALAVLDLGAGRYAPALQHCLEIDSHDLLPISTLALPMLIEAAVHCGDLATANAALDRFCTRATASGSDWSHGLLDCMRALVTNGPDTEKYYRAALDRLSGCAAAFDCAKAQLLYGEWLRRVRRRRDAREPLRAALEFFDRSGASAFAERARRELSATGEHSRPRTGTTQELLTAQERQIARLVADGHKNAEIASKLYISTSTVEYHLRKIYRKLGVTTRTRLARLEHQR